MVTSGVDAAAVDPGCFSGGINVHAGTDTPETLDMDQDDEMTIDVVIRAR